MTRLFVFILACLLLCSCQSQKSASAEESALMTDSIAVVTSAVTEKQSDIRSVFSVTSDSLDIAFSADRVRSGETVFYRPSVVFHAVRPSAFEKTVAAVHAADSVRQTVEHSVSVATESTTQSTQDTVAVAPPVRLWTWLLPAIALLVIVIGGICLFIKVRNIRL